MIDFTPENGFIVDFSENYGRNCYFLTTNCLGWPKLIIHLEGRLNAFVLPDINKQDTLAMMLEYLQSQGFNSR